ncbi:MAG: albicidin efflux pump [Microbacteriaceae bacterium]|nr:albicidin efflux pump [Microbacteriaceae bacterium]
MSSPTIPKRRVAAWALWDAGSAGINAITTTFVFNRYITSSQFQDPHFVATHSKDAVDAMASTQFGIAGIVTAVFVALIAPALGRQSDGSGRRKIWLGISTAVVVLSLLSLFFVQAKPSFLLYGLIVFSIGTLAYEIAFVQYNAMLAQVSTPKNVGRISGIGWASGYIAGIVLLLIVYIGLVAGSDPATGGLLKVPTADGLNIRIVELVAAIWTLIFSIPVLLSVPELPKNLTAPKVGFFQSYVQLFKLIAELWRTDRNTLRFLLASAVFRDGLAGVFTYGAIIAGLTFGFSTGEVLIFGIAANVVAGISTAVVGFLDDVLGPRTVMFASLVGLVVAGLAVFFLHDSGQIVFWIGGLFLCLFVGPAQSASRSFLTRVTPPERQGAAFGLYATTGRAATFLAPVAFTVFVAVGGATYWGMLGIVLIILIGLILLFFVKKPTMAAFYQQKDDLIPSK